jgi:integrase
MATVRKRRWGDGKWAWEIAYTGADGKRRREKCCSKKTADIRRKTIEQEIEVGAHIAKRETVTVQEAAAAWLADCERRHRVKDKMRGGSLRLYRIAVKNHIVPELGSAKLSKLDSARIQRFVDDKAETYKRQHELVRDVMKRIMDFAVRKKWLKRNPLVDEPVTIPPRDRKPVSPPSIADMRTVFETLEVRQENEKTRVWEQRKVFFCLGSLTGMRRGEIFALHWEDLDYEKGRINICRSFSPSDGFTKPKTKAGIRWVPLHPLLRRALEPVWERQGRPRTGLVLQTTHGKSAYGSAYEGWFKITMRWAGLLVPGNGKRTDQHRDRDKEPKFTIHEMRHFAISQWIAAGVPILEVSRMAGHADVNITLHTYGSLFEEYSKAQEGIDFAATAIMPPLVDTTYYSTPTRQGRAKGMAQLKKPNEVIDLQGHD